LGKDGINQGNRDRHQHGFSFVRSELFWAWENFSKADCGLSWKREGGPIQTVGDINEIQNDVKNLQDVSYRDVS
jgi:hypothetical protein